MLSAPSHAREAVISLVYMPTACPPTNRGASPLVHEFFVCCKLLMQRQELSPRCGGVVLRLHLDLHRQPSLIEIIFQQCIEPFYWSDCPCMSSKSHRSVAPRSIIHSFRNINGNLAGLYRPLDHPTDFPSELLTCTYEMLGICVSNVHTKTNGLFRRRRTCSNS